MDNHFKVGDHVTVQFYGKTRKGQIVRFGSLDGSKIRTGFVTFDDDPIGHKRNFGFRLSELEKLKRA